MLRRWAGPYDRGAKRQGVHRARPTYQGRLLVPPSDMSSTASTAPGGAPPAPNGVPLRCVGVVVWDEKGPVHVDEAGLRRGRADAAIRAARPVWVQLALPRLTRGAQSWFEGSVDPWDGTDAPELDWSAADRVLELVGAGPTTLDRHELRLLR